MYARGPSSGKLGGKDIVYALGLGGNPRRQQGRRVLIGANVVLGSRAIEKQLSRSVHQQIPRLPGKGIVDRAHCKLAPKTTPNILQKYKTNRQEKILGKSLGPLLHNIRHSSLRHLHNRIHLPKPQVRPQNHKPKPQIGPQVGLQAKLQPRLQNHKPGLKLGLKLNPKLGETCLLVFAYTKSGKRF